MNDSNYDANYKLLLDNANDVIIITQNNKIEFVNQKSINDLGYSFNDLRNKNIFNFIYIDDREKVIEYQIKKSKNEEFSDDLIFRIINKNRNLIFVKIFSITTLWKEKPAKLIIIKNITSKKLSEISLKRSENLLYIIVDNLTDPTFVIDINGKVFLWNKALEKISGIKSQDIIGKREYEYAIPFNGYNGSLLIDLMIKPDVKIKNEYDFFKRKDDILIAGKFLTSTKDKNKHIMVTSSILYDANGNIIGAVESFKDMTEIKNIDKKMKASINEKEILIKEIHHRVKNNMQLINSMLNIQLQYVKDPEAIDLFKDSISRIKTMGLIHNDLYSNKMYADINFAEFIPKLIYSLPSMYSTKEITIKVEAEDIHLGIDNAIPCGLILNELLTNSLKYAFPDGKTGKIYIKLFIDNKTNLCNLIVKDNGIGLPDGFDYTKNITSFGLLMVNLLTSQLQGNVRLNTAEGTEFTISFPIKMDKK